LLVDDGLAQSLRIRHRGLGYGQGVPPFSSLSDAVISGRMATGNVMFRSAEFPVVPGSGSPYGVD
jgi:hypothetical protein